MYQTLGGIYLTLYRELDEEEEVTVKYDDTVIVVALEVNLAYMKAAEDSFVSLSSLFKSFRVRNLVRLCKVARRLATNN